MFIQHPKYYRTMMIHYKLNISIYDTDTLFDKYGLYTIFIIPDKYTKYVLNGKTSKKLLTLLNSPIDVNEHFDDCGGSCGSYPRDCEFGNCKRLVFENLNDEIKNSTYKIFYTLSEKNENNKKIYIWNKTIEGTKPDLS